MMKIKNYSNKIEFKILSILFLALLIRVLILYFWPQISGDRDTYLTLAENISRGCGLSLSNPQTSECILTSETYFPGFPGFIAVLWFFFGKNTFIILLFNLLIYSLIFAYFLRSLIFLKINHKVIYFVGTILAFSPIQVGWFRFEVITEPLAISTSLWFASELIYSIAKKKLKILHLSAALTCSVFIRPDTILMVFCILPVVFYIYEIKKGIFILAIFSFITAIPISAWMIRNINLGHAPISMITKDYPGYISWIESWIIHEYERADVIHPPYFKNYKDIRIHNSNFISEEENQQVKLLIDQLILNNGKEFPKIIDEQFKKIAEKKLKERVFIKKIEINIKRIFYLLLNPMSSWGFPSELRDIDRKSFNQAIWDLDINYFTNFIKKNFIAITFKILILVYRIIFLTYFINLIIRSFLKKQKFSKFETNRNIEIFFYSAAIYFISRLLFFVYIVELEPRYLIESFIWIEISILLIFLNKRITN